MVLSKFMLFNGTQKILLLLRAIFESIVVFMIYILELVKFVLLYIFQSTEKMFIEIHFFSLAIQLYIRVNDH